MRSLLPILLIGVSIGLFYVHIDPSYKEVKTLLAQKSQYEDALQKASELKSKGQELLTKYNSISEDNIVKLEKLVPDKINTVKLVTDIDSIGGKHGITIRSVAVTEPMSDQAQQIEESRPSPYQTTGITFSFSATYPKLVLFLKDIEKSLQVVDIKNITFLSSKESKDPIQEYTVTLDAYQLK